MTLTFDLEKIQGHGLIGHVTKMNATKNGDNRSSSWRVIKETKSEQTDRQTDKQTDNDKNIVPRSASAEAVDKKQIP